MNHLRDFSMPGNVPSGRFSRPQEPCEAGKPECCKHPSGNYETIEIRVSAGYLPGLDQVVKGVDFWIPTAISGSSPRNLYVKLRIDSVY
jgi:hypothetical protein